ncbi:hypothetical protein MUK42_26517 [Musa troglodytarum]|uniref:Uncharacterized protein n=1 Tax=Musa troglodytarum TaxID=320322 RepID=A0A9E7F436_9LILI|nr:hypothetical protein MUK42_26517 [Musa troglodytarum]
MEGNEATCKFCTLKRSSGPTILLSGVGLRLFLSNLTTFHVQFKEQHDPSTLQFQVFQVLLFLCLIWLWQGIR